MNQTSLAYAAFAATLVACASPPPPPVEPVPQPTAAATATATAAATAKPAAEPAPKPVAPPSLADIKRPPPPKELEAAGKALAAKKWQECLDALEAEKSTIFQAAIDIRVRALTMGGLAHAMLEAPPKAVTEYRKAVSYLQSAATKLEGQIGKKDEAAFNKRLEAMNSSFAEALFYLAEEKRGKAAAIELSPYDGPADAAKVKKHFDTKVAQWMTQRQRAIDKAVAEYEKLDSLKPIPPPTWTLAASARVAQMRGELADALAANKAPDGWAKAAPTPAPAATPAVADGGAPAPAAASSSAPAPAENPSKLALAQFKTARDAALQPLVTQAREAFQRCADRASTADKDEAAAKYCKGWLATHK